MSNAKLIVLLTMVFLGGNVYAGGGTVLNYQFFCESCHKPDAPGDAPKKGSDAIKANYTGSLVNSELMKKICSSKESHTFRMHRGKCNKTITYIMQ